MQQYECQYAHLKEILNSLTKLRTKPSPERCSNLAQRSPKKLTLNREPTFSLVVKSVAAAITYRHPCTGIRTHERESSACSQMEVRDPRGKGHGARQ